MNENFLSLIFCAGLFKKVPGKMHTFFRRPQQHGCSVCGRPPIFQPFLGLCPTNIICFRPRCKMTFCDLKRVITFQATYFILRKLRALKCFAFLQIKIIDVKKLLEKKQRNLLSFFFLAFFLLKYFQYNLKGCEKVEEEGKKTSSNNSILVAMLRRFGHAF